MCQAFSGESAYLTAMASRPYQKCNKCGHQFGTHTPLGCPKCERQEREDHAAHLARIREAAERVEHHEDCAAEHCVVCGNTNGVVLNHYFGVLDSHNFKPGECNCPRGDLLAAIGGE